MESILEKCCKFVIEKGLIHFILSFSTVVLIIFTEFGKGSPSYRILWEIMLFHHFHLVLLIIIKVNIIKGNFFSRTILESTQFLKPPKKYILTH